MMFDIRKNVIASVAAIGSIAILLTACTDYYEQFSNEYAFGKAKDRFVFDGQTLTDLRNDQTYEVVKVGNLYWMNRNLGFQFYHSHFDDTKTSCHRPSEETCEQIGFLYPGTRLDDLCLDGWRLPSAEEWEEYYNSSAFTVTYGKDSYRGYESGDGSLNEDGTSAYFWTNDNTGNDHYRKCISFTPESNSFFSGANCHEQWKLSVRCVLDVDDGNAPSSSSGQNGEGKQSDCSVSDGVKVVEPGEGDVYQVHQTVKLVFGSDMDYGGFGVELRYDGGNKRINLLDQTIDNAIIDGKTCNEYLVDLPMDVTADDAFIYVYPYAKQSKNGKSGTFRIVESLSGEETGNAEDDAEEFSFKDSRNGREYNAMKIGGKNWMLDNLKYGAEENYCIDGCEDGVLYTWDAAMKACPGGWHLPSVEEWKSFFIAEAGREQAEWMRENSIYGNACTLTGNNASAANISVSVKPSAYQDTERCKSSSNYKDCGEFFVKVENNDAIGYTDLELHFYIALPGNEVSEMPESYIAHVSSPSGEVPSNPQIAFGQYTEDNTGRPYLPIFINGMLPPSGGKIIFQLLWHNTTFNRLQGGWSLVEHAGDEYVSQFDGIDLTVAPQSTGNELDDTYYTVDPYIPVYMYEQLVSGFPPDGSEVGQSATRSCVRVSDSYGLYYWTSDEVDSEEAYHLYVSGDSGIEDEYPLSSKADAAMLVRCVQD